MISHKYKFIFILLPKTGTTSIQSYLVKKDRKIPHLGTARHYDVINENVKDYCKISVSRNPYARMVSLWKYWKRKLEAEGVLVGDFHDFVTNLQCYRDKIKEVIKSVSMSRIYGNTKSEYQQIHFVSCFEGISVATDSHLTGDDIDYWIKFENLQEDFNFVCDKIGIPQKKLPHFNKSKHKHYTEYYDDETREIVAEKYAKDIEYFNYEFGEQ